MSHPPFLLHSDRSSLYRANTDTIYIHCMFSAPSGLLSGLGPTRVHREFLHYDIRPNRVCVPLQCTRYSQTKMYGRTHTTYSGLSKGQASVGPSVVCLGPPTAGQQPLVRLRHFPTKPRGPSVCTEYRLHVQSWTTIGQSISVKHTTQTQAPSDPATQHAPESVPVICTIFLGHVLLLAYLVCKCKFFRSSYGLFSCR